MLRRKVDQPEEPAIEPGDAADTLGDLSQDPAEQVTGAPVGPPVTLPDPGADEQPPIPGPVGDASATELPPPAPSSVPTPPPAPGPIAQHSPEPQTAAERLAQQQHSIHTPPEPDNKEQQKERREAARLQRKADKAKRKADKKAAKEARKARRQSDQAELPAPGPAAGALPPSPAATASASPVEPAPAGVVAATSTSEESSRPGDGVDLPPVTPPGGGSGHATRRTAPLIGGIDLGGTKIAAAVLDENHKVISYRRRPTPDRGGPADVVRAMATTMQEAAMDAGTEAHRLLAVGVGSPGSVNGETGAVSGAGNLPDWDGTFQLGMALREELGTEVRVGNDVQVGTRGEYELGAGVGYSSLLGVFWGTGVGGGIIVNGEPWLGRGRAGEIGHTLVRRGGAKGLNGLNGTVEAYAGRKAMEEKALREVKKGRKTKLFKLMKKHNKTHLTSAIWQRALDDGDELAEDLLNRAVGALSAGIASAVNLLDPEAVVIGGGLGVRFGDTLVPEIISGMDKYLLNKDNPPDIKVAALGDEGGVVGASLLVKDVLGANQAPST